MGAVLLLTPVVIAAWPAFATAVVSAAASLGYAAAEGRLNDEGTARKTTGIEIEVPNSEVVTGSLGRDEKIAVARDGVTIVFRRDERGKASLTVTGEDRSHEELRALGEAMSQRVVRDYVHQQILSEIRARGFNLVEESVDQNDSIHLTVRHWEN
jgi:hypothetical protein